MHKLFDYVCTDQVIACDLLPMSEAFHICEVYAIIHIFTISHSQCLYHSKNADESHQFESLAIDLALLQIPSSTVAI